MVWLRDRGGSFCYLLNLRHEAVARARHSFHIAGVFGGVAQRDAQTIGGSIQSAVKIDKRVAGPEALLQRLPADRFARPFEESDQNLKGFALQLDFQSVLPQFACLPIQLKWTKLDATPHHSSFETLSYRIKESWVKGEKYLKTVRGPLPT